MAELVKIDPKSIGVGQYQHDLNQNKLSESLKNDVEDCVNTVGVDLNTATPSLLQYVSGITPSIGRNIVKYREEKGAFKNRRELMEVSRLGDKAFEQCAGFLRISGGDNPLDNTAVHPESYDIARSLLEKLGYTTDDIKEGNIKDIEERIGKLGRNNISGLKLLAEELEVGLPTLTDIVVEVKKPGRDPRDEIHKPIFRRDVLKMEDLKVDMILTGTIRNVVDFGVFIDVGLKNDGLAHISNQGLPP